MQVSILNINWIEADAIGQTIRNQVEFFLRRGDEVRVYTLDTPVGVAPELARLARVTSPEALPGGAEAHFTHSDLYIYHYPCRHALMESMTTLERGVVLLHFHNVTPPELWDNVEEREFLALSRNSLPLLLAHADLIVTPSEFNARDLEHAYGVDPARVRVLPLSVPLDRFAPRSPRPDLVERYDLAGRRVLLFVGRIASNKRIDLLIDALALLHERYPDLTLLVVGEGSDSESQRQLLKALRAQVASLGLQDRVHFPGRVEEVAPYYNLADVYVTASLHEGFGVPLIEAMASGVPVVASNATAHPAVVAEAGLLVEAGSASALAEAVAHLLESPQQRQALIQRGLDRAARFSEPEIALQWSQIVAEATSWLPKQVYPRAHPESEADGAGRPAPSLPTPGPAHALPADIQARLDRLRDQAMTMDRSYSVRSDIPGLATVRHHLTSHLHKPYIDPTFERQSSWNQALVAVLHRLAEQTKLGDPASEQNGRRGVEWAFQRLDALAQQAVPMDRTYHVRSPIPGVARIRRHLTSHLHEPYVNPTFERQADFNNQVIAFLRELLARQVRNGGSPDAQLEELDTRQADAQRSLEAHIARLDGHNRHLEVQIARLEAHIGSLESRVVLAEERVHAHQNLGDRMERLDMHVQLLGQQLTLLLAERNAESESLAATLRETTAELRRSVAALRDGAQ